MTVEVQADEVLETLEEALVRSAYYVMGVLTRIGGEHDLSLSQLRVLGILRDRRLRMTDLAAHLGLDKSTMSGLVERAERRGLLARDKNPEDGRVVDVFATQAGHELMERMHVALRREMASALGRITPEAARELVRLLAPILEEAGKGIARPARGR
jgi:DNA-binding MarR family transcriptional regulator